MHTTGIDNMVPEFAREGIFLFVFLFGVVFFRAQSTYWLARRRLRRDARLRTHRIPGGHGPLV